MSIPFLFFNLISYISNNLNKIVLDYEIDKNLGEVKKTCYDSGETDAAEKPRISAKLFARKSLLERLDTLTSMDGISLEKNIKTSEIETENNEKDGPKRSSISATSYIKENVKNWYLVILEILSRDLTS